MKKTGKARSGRVDGYRAFVQAIEAADYTLAQLRCDVPPSDGLLALMDQVGLARYESYVLRWEREVG